MSVSAALCACEEKVSTDDKWSSDGVAHLLQDVRSKDPLWSGDGVGQGGSRRSWCSDTSSWRARLEEAEDLCAPPDRPE